MEIQSETAGRLSLAELLKLKRWNTPTVYNGWERIARDRGRGVFNIEETHDFMPQLGPMVGYAVTVMIEPSKPEHSARMMNCWSEYRRYIAGVPGPKIVVVQDIDKPHLTASFWGEVRGTMHIALGCVGTITDGAARDVDEMAGVGFKAIARRLSVGPARLCPVSWGCDVEVFGCTVRPGQLIHADKHGFLVVPEEDEQDLLDAALYMDSDECSTVIAAARNAAGKTMDQLLQDFDNAAKAYEAAARERFAWKAGRPR